MNCEMALTTSARMAGPRRAAKFRTVSCERRTAKFLSGPASPRNVAEYMTTLHSKRYDFKELGDQRSYEERGFLSFLRAPDRRVAANQIPLHLRSNLFASDSHYD